MTRSDLRVTFNALYRNKVFALINVLGLSIGISVAIVAYLLVDYDFSFNRFYKDEGRIYRIVSHIGKGPDTRYISGVPIPLANAIRSRLPGLQQVAAFLTLPDDLKVTVPRNGQMSIFKNQSNVIYAGPEYFNVFRYDWLAGTPQSALGQPYRVVLTKNCAAQYFPGLRPSDVVGQKLIFRDSILTTVSGIVNDPQGNTDLTFRVFVSMATVWTDRLRRPLFSNWMFTVPFSQLFIKLTPNGSPATVLQQLGKIYRKYNPEQQKSTANPFPFHLQPLRELHFDTRFGSYFGNRLANKPTLYGLVIGAAFLLILGCINFINLSTAQAYDRAKQFGIRKILGSSQRQLVMLFLRETFAMTLLAVVLSFILVPVILWTFSDFIPPELGFNPFSHTSIYLFLTALMVLVTLLSGIYPGWVLARYRPLLILKGNFKNPSNTSIGLRKGLILVQFIISQAFVIAAVFVGLQLRYALTKDLGFRKDSIIFFQTNSNDTSQMDKEVLLNKLKTIPGIASVSLSNEPAAFRGIATGLVTYSGASGVTETTVQHKFADSNYLSLFAIPIIAGRNIRDNAPLKECVINEVFSEGLGFKNPLHAIGKMLTFKDELIPIVGVMGNFNQESIHEPIKPLMLSSDPQNERNFNVLLSGSPGEASALQWKPAIGKVQMAFKQIYPDEDFTYDFLDETVGRYYSAEERLSFLLKYITGLTVFISCMGLMGLTVYSTNQRKKEISTRKVLGASIGGIVKLFSLEFIKLILIAFVAAVPVTYWFVHEWLNNFSYRISMSWWIFGMAGIFSLAIAWLTISFQVIRAAIANPAVILRTE